MDIYRMLNMLSIQKHDKLKWIKYYEFETYKWYDYLIDVIPNKKNILEIGCGGGVFYEKYRKKLVRLKNKYTCIDIDIPSIEYAKGKNNYVDFNVMDANTLKTKYLKQFDLLILVQSYIQISNIDNILKKYFNANPNGCVMMINTGFPDYMVDIATIAKYIFLTKQDNVIRTSLSLSKIDILGKKLNRKVTNILIGQSLSGYNEYLTIIHS